MRLGLFEIKIAQSRRKQVLAEFKSKGKLRAIKKAKELHGWQLKESKEYVDRLQERHGLDGRGKPKEATHED